MPAAQTSRTYKNNDAKQRHCCNGLPEALQRGKGTAASPAAPSPGVEVPPRFAATAAAAAATLPSHVPLIAATWTCCGELVDS